MSSPIDNDIAMRALRLALDGLSLRHQVTSNNIANVDTPGFRASEVSFEGQLRRLLAEAEQPALPQTARGQLVSQAGGLSIAKTMARTRAGHLNAVPVDSESAALVVPSQAPMRNDLNNVDIDRQMVELAETTINYSALTQLTSAKLSLLRAAINGGR